MNGTSDTSSAGPAFSSSTDYSADDHVSYASNQYTARRDISASAPPVWASSTVYSRGAIVQDNGQLWAPQVDDPNESTAPHLSTNHEWALYDPAHDGADWWLNSGGESATNSRIATVTIGASSTIAGAEPGANVTTNALHAQPVAGTSAKIDGVVTAVNGHVQVWAKDKLDVNGLAGAVAAGVVGVGAGILVLNVDSSTNAQIAGNATVSAGGQITVDAEMNPENTSGLAFAGTGGFVAVGAQVVVINDSGSQNAHIDSGATLLKAGGGIDVNSTASRTASADAIGVGIGAGAIGAAISVLNVSGDNNASIGNVAVGGTSAPAHINVSTVDNITADNFTIQVEGGVGVGIGAAVALVDLEGTATASSGAHGSVGSGGFTVTADGTRNVTVQTLNVTTGVVAVGVTVARADNARSIEANVTSDGNLDLSGTGDALVQATASNSADAEAPGGGLGGIQITVLIAIADLEGHTSVNVAGDIKNAKNITISSIADNTVIAHTLVAGVSIIGINGAVADATMDGTANIETTVTKDSELSGSGAIVVEAKTRNTNNTATATAEGGSAGLLFAGTVFVGVATIDGGVKAHMNGHVTAGASLDVKAIGVNDAEAHTLAGSVSLGGALAGSVSYANVSSNADVVADAASTADIAINGKSTFKADGTNIAKSTAEVISFGFIALGVSVPTSTIGGSVTAGYDGTVKNGAGLDVQATGQNTATVDSTPIAGGVFAGQVAAAEGDITQDAQVQASVGKEASLDVGGAAVLVTATATDTMSTTLDSAGFGGLAVSVMFATSHDSGGSQASFDGELKSASSLDIETNATRNVTTKMFVVAIGVGAALAFAKAEADIGAPDWISGNDYDPNDLVQYSGDTYRAKNKIHNDTANPASDSGNWAQLTGVAQDVAWIGSDAKIHSTGTDIAVKATRVASTFSRSDGGAGGIFASGVLMKTVTAITGAVKAYVDDNATVGTDAGLNPGRPARLLVQAKDDANAAATATVGSGAIGFTAAASDAEATASPTVDAHVGKNATLTISETPNANTCGFGSNPPTANVCILAVSDDAEADANAESYSGSVGIQVGEPEATATSNPVANAYIGDGTVVVTGGNVIVQAESNANKPDPNKTFGDNITAVTPDGSSGTPTTSCGFAEDSVCYTAHGLITGSQVKYVVDGGTLIDGLVANHLYTVIVVDDNTLRFGDTFSGQAANADTIVIGAMGVDGNRSMVRFATPHNFETGDAVVYRNTGYTPDRGTWAAHTDYANGDFVIDSSDGKLYRAKGTTPR